MVSTKVLGSGWGTPGNEYVAIRWAAARVRKFRNMMHELCFFDQIDSPTLVYCDRSAVG